MNKIIEIILIVLSLIIGVLWCFHIDHSGKLLEYILWVLARWYLFLGFAIFNKIPLHKIFSKETYKSISQLKIIKGILSGITISILISALKFKISNSPGGLFLMWFGILCSFAILIVSIIKFKTYYRQFMLRTIVYSIIVISIHSIPLKKWLDFKYPNNPEYVEAYMKARLQPENKELWKIVEIEYNKIIPPK